MIQRAYEPPQFNMQPTGQYQQSQLQRVDPNAKSPIMVGDASWRDKLLEQLGRQGVDLMQKLGNMELANQYLEGQAQAGIVESEAELQTSPLTADWKIAGYRDTMGTLALAESKAQFGADLAKLREKDGEELQAYLAERRNKLMPGISGMSREARAAAAGQMLLQDRAAISSWTAEHAKFIVEQQTQAIHTQWFTTLKGLGQAQTMHQLGQMPDDKYQDQVREATGVLVGAYLNPHLDGETKQEVITQMLLNALDNGSVDFYHSVASNDIAIPGQAPVNLIAVLSGERQGKLADAFRAAKQRTSDARNFAVHMGLGDVEAQISQGVYKGSYSNLVQYLQPMVQDGIISAERATGIVQKYLNTQYNAEQSSALAQKAMAGDAIGILNSGNTFEDALKGLDEVLAKRKASPEERLVAYIQAGSNGTPGAFKRAGNLLSVTMQQLRDPENTMLEQHKKMFTLIDAATKEATSRGWTSAKLDVISGLDERDRMFATRIFTGMGNNQSFDQAKGAALELENSERAMLPGARAAQSAAITKEALAEVGSLDAQGLLGRAWTWMKQIVPFGVGERAKARLQLSRGNYLGSGHFRAWGDSQTDVFYSDQSRKAVAEEITTVARDAPLSRNAGDIADTAFANVLARTIQTKYGPVIMPRGSDMSKIFSVEPSKVSAIGKAIDSMLTEHSKDSDFQVVFANGKVGYQEVDSKGVPMGAWRYVTPADVKRKVDAQQELDNMVANDLFGRGVRKKVNGVELTYNGHNSAGVPTTWMMGFRNNLVRSEGVVTRPAPDLSGKIDKNTGKPIETVGVGVSSHNTRWFPKPGPDGKITDEQVNNSFVGASNDAAVAGARVAAKIGKWNQGTFQLFAEISYQSGTSALETFDSYKRFLSVYQTGDVAKAKEAFKQTPAYKYSGNANYAAKGLETPRQKQYMSMIDAGI